VSRTSGEFHWRGHHTDGTDFAMAGVVILTIRDGEIAEGRLYMEPVDQDQDSIDAAVEQLYAPPEEQHRGHRAG